MTLALYTVTLMYFSYCLRQVFNREDPSIQDTSNIRNIYDEAMLNLTENNFFAGISIEVEDKLTQKSYLNDSIYEYFSIKNVDNLELP